MPGEFQIPVRHVNDRRISNDVLLNPWFQSHLRHGAREVIGGVGVDAEADRLAWPDAANIRFVEIGDDLHLGEIGGQHEERRRLHAGGDCLADVHAARDHEAIDWRFDYGVLKVDLVLAERGSRLCDLRLLRPNLCLRAAHGHFGGVEFTARQQLPIGEFLGPIQLGLRVRQRDAKAFEVRFGTNQVGAGLFDLGLKRAKGRGARAPDPSSPAN